ncbi:MAG: FAD-dependent oxidoreductase [Gammaproteobacteria bacterium]|nr:FAD-dependent oxidoreductase [Gammaproteobacteria bacterium]
MNSSKYQVIVVGAGISGLRCATLLQKAGLSVKVLEANHQVGGRLRNHKFNNGDKVDIGGQWVGPGQNRMYALIDELKAKTYPLYNRGKNILRHKGRLKTYVGVIPRLPVWHLIQVGWLLWRFDSLVKTIDCAAPYENKHAEKWDGMTLQSWINKNSVSETARKVFALGVSAVFTVEAKEISLLHALFYAKSGLSLDNLISVDGGAQQDRVHEGTAGLCETMALGLGDALELNAVVERVSYQSNEVEVKIRNQEEILKSDRIIFAIAPNQLQRLQFDPPMPLAKDQMWQHMPAGSCIKCVAQYEVPFWRELGLSGQSVCLDEDILINVSFDNSQKGKTSGLLMGFIEGKKAREWSVKSDADRKQAVLASFAAFFGPQALNAIDYVDQDWSKESYIRGCYAANFTPGAWTEFGVNLRTPIGPIHFAGTETANQWYGYMEGGLEAAERAVNEVIKSLGFY